jgi:hypothetical protein
MSKEPASANTSNTYIRTDNPKSANAMHFLNNGQEQGLINPTMDLSQPYEKGTTPRLDSWENYCM